MTTFYATHALGRASSFTADADAVCQRINELCGSNGDNQSREAVQAEVDLLASAELKISVMAD